VGSASAASKEERTPEGGEGKDSSMPKPILTFWYEFASTYSWLAAERVEALAAAADVQVNWRPFLLGPIFVAQGWQSSPFNLYAAKGANMWRDIERQCELMDLPPPTRPEPFPQNSLLAARVATALPKAARPAFSRAVYRAEFTRGQAIADRAVIAELLRDCGLDAEATLAAAETAENKAALRAGTQEAATHGIYGAPSFVTPSGELFWGNDRLEQALAWAKREA
jgi:2-hydroxychromene-2-carboxylate isomerase